VRGGYCWLRWGPTIPVSIILGQAVRCGGVEAVAVHEDDVAGFAGQLNDAERYAVDDGPVVQVALYTVAAAAGFLQPAQPRMGGERGAYPDHAERLAVVEIRRHQPVRTGHDERAAATGAHLFAEGEELHGPLPG
jgi:hypothetical protein